MTCQFYGLGYFRNDSNVKVWGKEPGREMLYRILREGKRPAQPPGEWFFLPPGELPRDVEPMRFDRSKSVEENLDQDGCILFPQNYMETWRKQHMVSHMKAGVTMIWTTVGQECVIVEPPKGYDNLVKIRRQDGAEVTVVLDKLCFPPA